MHNTSVILLKYLVRSIEEKPLTKTKTTQVVIKIDNKTKSRELIILLKMKILINIG